jgi:hypothetical protein
VNVKIPLLWALCIVPAGAAETPPAALAHVERRFEFIAEAPLATVAPLFGADKERLWAPGWEPTFLWPAAAQDRPGMVFTISSARGQAIWVNTAYEPEKGRFQYAYVIPRVMVTLITLELRPQAKRTHVAVRYERTSLAPEANAVVAEMAESDGRAGPEWAAQVNDYLARGGGRGAID